MKKFSNTEISGFCEDLAMLMDSGVTEEESIVRMVEDEKSHVAAIVRENYDVNLSSAMEDSGCFPSYMVDMIEIGQSTGRLTDVLLNLADYYDKQEDSQSKIGGIIVYPSILLFILSGVVLFITMKIFPLFKDVYKGLGYGEGSGTQNLITAASIISWGLFIFCLATALIFIICFIRWKKSINKGEMTQILSRIPYTSRVLYEVDLAKFTSAVSSYYSAGIDLESAVNFALKLVSVAPLKEKIQGAIDDIRKGNDIAASFRTHGIYGAANSRTMFGAITSGRLTDGLSKMAGEQWRCANDKLNDITDSVEPMTILIVAVVTGLIIISIMMPLISIMTAMA